MNRRLKNISTIFCICLATFILNACKKKDSASECPNCPAVTSISPVSTYFDSVLTIYGVNFSDDLTKNKLKINGTLVDDSCKLINLSHSTTQFSIKIPKGIGSGTVTVDLDQELTNFGTPPIFNYLYTPIVSTLVGDPAHSVHVFDPSPTTMYLGNPKQLEIDNDILLIRDTDNSYQGITKIYNNYITCQDLYVTPTFYFDNFSGNINDNIFYYGTWGRFYLLYTSALTGSSSQSCSIDGTTYNQTYKLSFTGNSVYQVINYLNGDSSSLSKSDDVLNPCDMHHLADNEDGTIDQIKIRGNYLYALNKVKNKIYKVSLSNPNFAENYSLNFNMFITNSIDGFDVSGNGIIYIASHNKQGIYCFTSHTDVKLVAGPSNGIQTGYSSVPTFGLQALFNSPQDLVFDSHGNLFVSDMGNHCIRKIIFQ